MAKSGSKDDRGEKMIEIKVRFWTDISGHDKVRQRHGLTSGEVRIKPNKTHGIKSGKKAQKFNSLLDLSSAIEQVLKDNGVVLHISRGMKTYIATEAPKKHQAKQKKKTA